MKQAKPLLTIKQDCKDCDGEGGINIHKGLFKLDCKSCKGIGHNKIEFYALRDFEKEVFDIREQLSELEHEQWEYWSKELGKYLEEWKQDLPEQHNEVIEKINNRLSRWEANWKSYNKLDEKTKDYDRKWADKVIEIIKLKGIGYKIPFKNYEIKKVSEINTKEFTFNQSWNFWDEVEKHNLKEDDKVVITNAK